jgi:ubiquinol-cytochrome c reductase iron-sulfur subunit
MAQVPSAPQPNPGTTIVDVADLRAGELKVVLWRNRRVWVLRRSAEAVARLEAPALVAQLADPASEFGAFGNTPAYAKNNHRSIQPDVFIGIAVCPHAGCEPVPRLKPGSHSERPDNWPGGFACQCHFATFDLAGRVFKGKPTSENIQVPRHMYLSPTRIVIGRDQDGEA